MSYGRKFTVILDPEPDGSYSVHCPALSGCVSQGNNREDALRNILKAIELVLETIKETGIPLPAETPAVITEEIHEILKAREEEGLPLTVETAQVELPSEVPV